MPRRSHLRCVTIYFWWQNTKGIEESSEKALRVMQITTVMVVILMGWSFYTLCQTGISMCPLPTPGNLHFSAESLGFLHGTNYAQDLAKKFGILWDSDSIRPLRTGHERRGITGPGQP